MDKTKNDDDNVTEQVRLEDQHETVVAAMEGLQILDSACANGAAAH